MSFWPTPQLSTLVCGSGAITSRATTSGTPIVKSPSPMRAKRSPTSCRRTSSTPRRGDTTSNRPGLTPARSPSGSTPRCSRCPMCTQAQSMVGARTSRRRAGPRWKTSGQRSPANAASAGSREPGSPRAALFRIRVLQVVLRTHLDKPVRLLKSLDHSHGQRTFGRRSHDRF